MRWLIWALWAGGGLGWFFWLGYEDIGLGPVLLLSMWLSAAYVLTLWRRWAVLTGLSWGQVLIRTGLAGLVAGLTTAPLADVFMLAKIALHAHPVPDFSTQDLLAVLARTPVWTAAGLAAGLAWGLWMTGRTSSPRT
jgi:hypothetical protein